MAASNPRNRTLALTLTVLGAVARILPHPPNFTPAGATSVFAGARLPAWQAYLVPMVLMVVSDFVLAAWRGYSMFHGWVYASLLIAVWIGRRLTNTTSVAKIGAATLASSVQFFVLTNFGEWFSGSMYPHTAAGLGACYVAAIPFFERTLAGDLLYTGAMFGLYAMAARWVKTESRVPVAV